MDKEQKLPEFEFKPQSEFAKKLDNFWFYNKWKVIFGIFILFAVIVCVAQCATREDYDVSVLYGGAFSSADTRVPDMESSLNSVNDGGVGLSIMEIYDKDYVANNPDKVNASTNSQNYDSLCQLITTGEYSVLILDKWIYDEIHANLGMRSVKDVCGEAWISNDALYDEYAVYFKKTDFYKRYSSTFGGLSDDCVICLCIYSPYKATVGCSGSSGDDDYQKSVDLFRDILTYSK